MAVLYNINKNNYVSRPKNSTIYTPERVSIYLKNILSKQINPKVILDPAIGKGALVRPWDNGKRHIIGVDIDNQGKKYCNTFIHKKFEVVQMWVYRKPDLIICNPPFNGAPRRQLYPEVFLRRIVKLFGNRVPIVIVAPIGLRLNVRIKSARWQWMNENLEISSIVSLPIDCFGVKFHTEILIFNINGLKPHYPLYG